MLVSDFPISTRSKNCLLEAGYKTEEDFKGKTIDDIKEIKGMGANSVSEVREFLYTKFKFTFKLRPRKKVQNGNQARAIVHFFLKHRSFINWAKEMMTANSLLKHHSFEFLLSVTPNKNVGTLTYYFTEEGKAYLRKHKPTLAVYTKQEVKEETSEVEVEYEFQSTSPKSIRDFLKK